MKKILLSGVALLGLTAVSTAADLPRRVVAPAPFVAVPVFTWTGFYVGANAGYGFSDSNDDDGFGFGFGGNSFSTSAVAFGPTTAQAVVIPGATFGGFGNGFGNGGNDDGFVGGAQVGFNYQFTPGAGLVIGIEADIQYTDFGSNDDGFGFGGFGGFSSAGVFGATPTLLSGPGFGVAPTAAGAVGNVFLFNNAFGNQGFGNRGSDSDWFATVRGRIGYAFDRFLVFGTAGVAFREDNNDNGFGGFGFGTATPGLGFFNAAGLASIAATGQIAPTNTFLGFGQQESNSTGYAIGGGIEYAFTNNLTVKLEALYVDFDDDDNGNAFGFGFGGNQVVGVSNTNAPITGGNLGLFGNNQGNSSSFTVVRAGVNFKFSSF